MKINMLHIGYEIRERIVNDPHDPIPNYPLGFGSVTMDSNLCRPCIASGYCVKEHVIYLYDRYEVINEKFLSIEDCFSHGDIYREKPGSRSQYKIFGYFLEAKFVDKLARMEEREFGEDFVYFRRETIVQESLPEHFEVLGYDVIRSTLNYDRWESELANEGIPVDVLTKYGEIGKYGLYKSIQGAINFKMDLLRYIDKEDTDLPFIVKIVG